MDSNEKQVTVRKDDQDRALPTGTVELIDLEQIKDFEKQRRHFDKHGIAKNPENPSKTIGKAKESSTGAKKARIQGGDNPADLEGFVGPWAGWVGERKGDTDIVGPTEEEVHRWIQAKAEFAPTTLEGYVELGQEKSVFHGQSERDELGRTYMHYSLPSSTRTLKCYAPKGKLVHMWTGHTKGVNCIRFIPHTGHLLLSAGQDQRIKLWDVEGSVDNRECVRTFYGHNKPVRQVEFSIPNGRRFVSCAFDKTVKVWDTETGSCLAYRSHRAIPYCARFLGDDEQTLLVGTADRKIIQIDLRSGGREGAIVCEYRGHRDAVDTITMLSDTHFVTSSDDRTLRIWRVGVPSDSQLIHDSEMKCMPVASRHPTEPYLAFQSLDNRIPIYSISPDGTALTRRSKRFIGHITGGYGCQVGFSPDGRFIYSGDSRGFCSIWDWQKGAMVRRLEAHQQVCMGVEWHPHESNRVATCSWDGTIKYWQ